MDAPPPGSFNYSDTRDYSVSESLDLLKQLIEIVRSGETQEMDLTSIIDRLEAEHNGVVSAAPAAAPPPLLLLTPPDSR